MKLFLRLAISLLVAIVLGAAAQASAKNNGQSTVTLGVFDQQNKTDFESKVLPFLKQQISSCGYCEIRNFTPYDDKGQFNSAELTSQIEVASRSAQVILLNWNEKLSESNKAMAEMLTKVIGSGVAVVVAAGKPQDSEASAPLKKTIAGQIPEALIIGELGERERLIATSFFGPEMLTAIRPPKNLDGQGLSPGLFAARLASDYNKRAPGEWISYLKVKKANSRKLWPGLEDFFGR